MTNPLSMTVLSRRALLQASGALIVTAAGPLAPLPAAAAAQSFAAKKPPLDPAELDSWIAIAKDGHVTAFYGKTDAGQGIDVAVAQIVAEELDAAFESVSVVMGDTERTLNQGGASNSTGIKVGAQQLRQAAAEARRVLLEAASDRLGLDAAELAVAEGVVTARTDPSRRITYAELIGGRYFDRKLEWNGKRGNDLEVKGKAAPKHPSAYKVVGRSMPRADMAAKACGTLDYVTDIRLPGMLHARVLRPPVAGAVPVSVDEASLAGSGARAVRIKDFLAVVAEKEWNAIRAAQRLKVAWSAVPAPFPEQQELYAHIRAAPAMHEKTVLAAAGLEPAFAEAAKTIEADYDWPFQSHAAMGPACALAAVTGDKAILYTASAKPHYAAQGVARTLGIEPENVHAIWMRGPGAYGRNDADDTAVEAALISQATGRPVRLQSMRHDATGWDPKAPAGAHSARAAFDAQGNVLGYEFVARAFSTVDVNSNGSQPRDLWVGQLLGASTKERAYEFGVPADSYKFPNKQMSWHVIAPLLDRCSPLRTSHMRDTSGPQLHFASECFTDEMAVAAGSDPVAFRLRYIGKERERAAIQAVVDKAGWEPRSQARRRRTAAGLLAGQGIAYAFRGGTVVALIAEVEVDTATGRIWTRKFTVAHDCGLIINPAELSRVIEANLVQATSRSLREEVAFDRSAVTSVDWASYPILEMPDAPEAIDVILIDRPEIAPSGAGEPSSRPVPAAIANAVYDATGVRLRRAPFTPERVKAALATL